MDYNKLIHDFYKEFTKNKIHELLNIISKNYPNNFSNDKIIDELEYIMQHIEYTTNKKPRKKMMKEKKIIDSVDQCCARSWDNIYSKNNNNIITSLPKKFKCEDLDKFKLKEFNEIYCLGKRCIAKKHNSKYCKLHEQHLVHGDFNELPTVELCYHFIKDNKILFY
jgi:hypothetical protein